MRKLVCAYDKVPYPPICLMVADGEHYWIVAVLLVSSALEVWIYFRIMRHGGAVYTSQAGYVAVVAGILWGALFFGQELSAWLIVSLLSMLLALYLVAPRVEVSK